MMPFSTHRTETVRDRLQAERPAVELACAYLSGDRTAAVRAAYDYYKDELSESKTRRRAARQRTAEQSAHD